MQITARTARFRSILGMLFLRSGFFKCVSYLFRPAHQQCSDYVTASTCSANQFCYWCNASSTCSNNQHLVRRTCLFHYLAAVTFCLCSIYSSLHDPFLFVLYVGVYVCVLSSCARSRMTPATALLSRAAAGATAHRHALPPQTAEEDRAVAAIAQRMHSYRHAVLLLS